MAAIATGSYVTHEKLPQLGSGEVLAAEKGALRIRFASGERSFSMELAAPYLTVTDEAPVKASTAKKKSKKKV